MSGRWRIWNETLRALAAEARAVHPPEAVGYEWIPRKQNKHADRLANRAMDAGAKRGRKAPQATGVAGAAAAAGAAGRGGRSPEPGPRVVATTFLLLRHGATAVTPEKRFSGIGDPPLAAEGRRQAARAAESVATAYPAPDVVISSPLARCRATAQVAADRLGGLPVLVEPDLRETDFGAWEGLTFAEAAREHPAAMEAWLNDPDAAPPDGESFTEVTERVAAARDRLLAAHTGRTLLIVSHVTPIKTLVRLALAAGPEALYRIELAAASLTDLRYYSDGPVSLRTLNDTAHLR
jgi:probable phosphoglycerate mutase